MKREMENVQRGELKPGHDFKRLVCSPASVIIKKKQLLQIQDNLMTTLDRTRREKEVDL